jgi:hypothetical protein
MGKLERLAAARERVRKWKEGHPKSVKWQRERRYARQKEGRRVMGVEMVKRASKAVKVQYGQYGETHLGDIEGVDVAYGQMGSDRRGGHGRTNTGMGQADELRVARADKGGSGEEGETANEAGTYAKLAELKARQARGGLNAGVEVDLIL